MGKRNCAFEGCNALEFRTSGYCLQHKDDHPWIAPVEPTLEVVAASKEEWKEKEEEFWKSPFALTIVILGMAFPVIILLLIPIYMIIGTPLKGDLEPYAANNNNCVIDGCNAMKYQESEYCLRHEPSMVPGVETGKLESNEEDDKKWWDVEDGHDADESYDVDVQSPISILINQEKVGWHLICYSVLVFFFIFWVLPRLLDPWSYA